MGTFIAPARSGEVAAKTDIRYNAVFIVVALVLAVVAAYLLFSVTLTMRQHGYLAIKTEVCSFSEPNF